MYDCKNIYLVRLDVIYYSIRPFNEFPYLLNVKFRNDSAG